jgi:thiamine-phosphate pyrophosphorylase
LSAVDITGCHLYGIVDLSYVKAESASRVAREMINGGVDIIQLRAKGCDAEEIATLAEELHRITSTGDVPLVINDRAEIAQRTEAEGVHVGQDDISIAQARKIAGSRCFVGRSTHSLEQAKEAALEGADYIGFGPLFATPTKPDYTPIGLDHIQAVHAAVSVPIFCIGGIKLENLPSVLAAGARRVVIVSGLLCASDIAQYARAAKELLDRKSKI